MSIRILALSLCLLLMSACQTLRNTTPASQVGLSVVIQDSVSQLKAFYPPAQARFALTQKPDTSARALVHAMRQAGFSVDESGAKSRASLPLALQIAPIQGNLYRVTLDIGDGQQQFSRLYALDNQSLLRAASSWSHRE